MDSHSLGLRIIGLTVRSTGWESGSGESNLTSTHDKDIDTQTSRYHEEFMDQGKLGKGGFGSVYKAENRLDGKPYAVKKIRIRRNFNMELTAKLLREVKVLAKLSHTYIVRYHAAWMEYNPGDNCSSSESSPLPSSQETENSSMEQDSHSILFDDEAARPPPFQHGLAQPAKVASNESIQKDIQVNLPNMIQPVSSKSGEDKEWDSQSQGSKILYIQMELCTTTLKEWMSERNNRLQGDQELLSTSKDIMQMFHEILEGVKYIHSQDIIHRDLKPENIFLQGDTRQVKIGDFGLAKEYQCNEGGTEEACCSISENHSQGVGTTTYAAPEQLTGTAYDSKCDVYSLGIILFEMCHLFTTDSERLTTIYHLRDGTMSENFTLEWRHQAKAVQDLTNKDPARRPSAQDVLGSQLFLTEDPRIHAEIAARDAKIAACDAEIAALHAQNMELRKQLQMKLDKDAAAAGTG